ncbi:hypothetical protein Y032_0051g2106 [Ancylostoma ceylanicum]|uniref:Uncharacterized protein n=1 Tax=Ancylostoma ceylanicum TaxID=53326 RepID=A0A016U8K1_9BILA|nr:hypothetical protein Y032_0051g2106 [Ancylostoma ceylanicum]
MLCENSSVLCFQKKNFHVPDFLLIRGIPSNFLRYFYGCGSIPSPLLIILCLSQLEACKRLRFRLILLSSKMVGVADIFQPGTRRSSACMRKQIG